MKVWLKENTFYWRKRFRPRNVERDLQPKKREKKPLSQHLNTFEWRGRKYDVKRLQSLKQTSIKNQFQEIQRKTNFLEVFSQTAASVTTLNAFRVLGWEIKGNRDTNRLQSFQKTTYWWTSYLKIQTQTHSSASKENWFSLRKIFTQFWFLPASLLHAVVRLLSESQKEKSETRKWFIEK